MAKGLILQIAENLKSYPSEVFLIEDNDRFLYRKDVVESLELLGIEVTNGSNFEQRIRFEMREPDGLLVLLYQNNSGYLEDIKKQAVSVEFRLVDYLQGYHITSVINLK